MDQKVLKARLELAYLKRAALISLLATTRPILTIEPDESDVLARTAHRIFRKSYLVGRSIVALGKSEDKYISVLALSRLLVENTASLDHLIKHPDEVERFLKFYSVQNLLSFGPYMTTKQRQDANRLIRENGFRTPEGNLRWSSRSVNTMIKHLSVSEDIRQNLEHGFAEGSAKIHLSPIDTTNSSLSLSLSELDCGFHTATNAFFVLAVSLLDLPPPGIVNEHIAERVDAIISNLYEAAKVQARVIKRSEAALVKRT